MPWYQETLEIILLRSGLTCLINGHLADIVFDDIYCRVCDRHLAKVVNEDVSDS